MKISRKINSQHTMPKVLNASITVEASFIYPIILVFIMLTIIYCFYCHDKVATKSNAYASLIKSYFNEDTSYDKSDFESSLNSFCLLKNNYTCSYDNYAKRLCLIDNYGNFYNVGFSSFERCDFIRQYYCLIKQIIIDNDKNNDENNDERN